METRSLFGRSLAAEPQKNAALLLRPRALPTTSVALVLLCCFLSVISHAQRGTGRSFVQRPLADSFVSDNPDNAALLLAAYTGDIKRAEQLVDAGADVDARQQNPHFNRDWTPLCFAISKSYLSLVTFLLEHRAHVQPCGLPIVPSPEIIRLLLKNGADPNEGKDQYSRNTPLLNAAMNWWTNPPVYTTIITLLLEYGADPNARNAMGHTALLEICANPFPTLKPVKTSNPDDYYPKVVRALVEHGARINDTMVYDLDDACCASPDYRDGVPYCRVMTPEGCNLLAQSAPCEPGRLQHFESGITPLMQAVQSNSPPSWIIALLDAGSDPSLKDRQSRTALDMATTEEMKTLLRSYSLGERRAATTSIVAKRNTTSHPVITTSATTSALMRKAPLQGSGRFDTDVHKNEFICYQGPNQRATLKETADSSFGSERLLDVVVNDPSHLQDAHAEADMATEISNALVIWRRMCSECATANAAVLKLNGRVYLDPNLKSILDAVNYSIDYETQRVPVVYAGPCSPSATPPKFVLTCPTCNNGADSPQQQTTEKTTPTAIGQHDEPTENKPSRGWPVFLSEGFLSTRLGVRVPLFQYVAMDLSDPSIAKVCAAPYAKVPPILKGARAAFGCGADASLSPTSRAFLKIKLVDGYTSCGHDNNIVGCESSEFMLELNAARYKFVKHGTGQSLFGRGTLPVDLQVVLLHELGHWVGIQRHLASPRNIMSAYLNDAHCIDETVVTALANATQVPANQGRPLPLYYRRPAVRSAGSSSSTN